MEKKITIIATALIILFSSCKTEPMANDIKKEVLNIHDKLMIDGEKVVKNRMALDSVLKSNKIKSSQDSLNISDLVIRLNKADENMMDWMHFFKDDFKGKNEQEDLEYYKSQMIKIRAVEDEYITVTKASDSVLKIYNIKPADKMEMKHDKH